MFRVNPGSLLPPLSPIERTGQVRSEWRATENNRRAKYYIISNGRNVFAQQTQQWDRRVAAIRRILEV